MLVVPFAQKCCVCGDEENIFVLVQDVRAIVII